MTFRIDQISKKDSIPIFNDNFALLPSTTPGRELKLTQDWTKNGTKPLEQAAVLYKTSELISTIRSYTLCLYVAIEFFLLLLVLS